MFGTRKDLRVRLSFSFKKWSKAHKSIERLFLLLSSRTSSSNIFRLSKYGLKLLSEIRVNLNRQHLLLLRSKLKKLERTTFRAISLRFLKANRLALVTFETWQKGSLSCTGTNLPIETLIAKARLTLSD